MPVLTHRATLYAGYESYVTALSDLEISVQDGNVLLYGATGTGGGLSAFRLTGGGIASLVSTQALSAALGHLGKPQIEILPDEAGLFSLSLGLNTTGPTAFRIGADGAFGGRLANDSAAASLGGIVAAAQLQLEGRTLLYASKPGKAVPAVYETGIGGAIRLVSEASGTTAGTCSALVTLFSDGAPILIAANAATNELCSHQINEDGTLGAGVCISDKAGIGISAPAALATATLHGRSYVIVGGAGSSSLSVLRVSGDGSMTATDHLVDGLDTRFKAVTALRSFAVGDRAYVLAGGGDDGMSLFTLLPNGQLIHLTTIEDSAAMTLADMSALAVWAGPDGAVQIFAGSASETGVTQLALDLGTPGESRLAWSNTTSLWGSSGNDLLMGSTASIDLFADAGDDLLVTGRGAARLWGGAGADTFAISGNGAVNRIMDFQPGTDLIDLSRMPLLRSAAQLGISPTSTGATLSYLETTLHISTADGTSLTAAQLAQALRLPGARYEPSLDYEQVIGIAFGADAGTVRSGTADRDDFTGGQGYDLLRGHGGNDHLIGGGHNDTIEGGSGNDTMTGGTLSLLDAAVVVRDFGAQAGGWSTQEDYPRLIAQGAKGGAIVGFGNRGTYLSVPDVNDGFSEARLAVDNFGTRQGWTSYSKFPRLVGDFDNDGFDDIIGFGVRGALVSYGTTTGGFAEARLAVRNLGADQGWTSFDRFPRIIGDVNGDGHADAIGFGIRGTLVALARHGGGFAETRLYVRDFGTNQGWSSNDRFPRTIGDVNGDGFDDIIGFGKKGTIIALSDGKGELNAPRLMLAAFGTDQGWASNKSQQRFVTDLNGDGLDDIIGLGTRTTSIALSLGGGKFHALQSFSIEARSGWAGQELEPRYLADMNGDAVADVVTFTTAGVAVALSLPDADTFIFDDGFGRDRITDFDARNPYERLDFSRHSLLDSYTKVKAAMTQSGENVVIKAGNDILFLDNVLMSTMGPDDFIF